MAEFVSRTIVSLPEALLEVFFIFLAVAFCVALHFVLQQRLRSDVLRRHNDVAGYLFSAVGVLYAVVLGFVVVVVWQKYDASVSNVENEVDATADLYHAVDGYTGASRSRIRSDLARYARIVVMQEWPAMAAGQRISWAAASQLEDAAYRVDAYSPRNWKELAAQQAAIADMQRLFDARRQRLVQAVPAVPAVLWFALVCGALAMVAFCYIFGVENRPAQLLMTAILVGLIGLLFVVIAEFSTPFSGSVRISPEGWQYFQQRMHAVR
ncbi:MAG: DUF4239 domain-containing protein [Candidatus Eremiobacteraeota bacterium]|nr:DUF4239 domain-containing protein [Candidatus Eremiobacteraeota bacterium]MBV9056832.1 DUF4239 domain-containing protein [Candidatus Eremiobacteraeota bacterium]MBV9700431.1 DUF4239 domain-containing protein [Candidatus Eremiobacteraeota bacterium]